MDQVILEQFLKTLADDVRVFVRERNPATSSEAAKLADDYLQARKEDQSSKELFKKEGDKSTLSSLWKAWTDCRVRLRQPQEQERVPDHSSSSRSERPRIDLRATIATRRDTTHPIVRRMLCCARREE